MDGWTSGEVLGPSSRRDGFDSRTVYQQHTRAWLNPKSAWPLPRLGEFDARGPPQNISVVFNSSTSVSKTEGRGAKPCGDASSSAAQA